MLKSIKVSDYMAASLVTFKPDMEMRLAISLLVEKRISGAPVVDDHGNLVGILSEQDCMKVALSAGYYDDYAGQVKDYMSKQVTTIEADTSILALAQLFIDSPFRRYPVMQNNRLVGQVSRRDVLRALEALA
ncbi:CBS domain-containing protein [Granulosicoccus antarcticus]|uniref:Hypoxic response protein 1 n=1 Tax=Granulosicoccus antarcticus IMCC3135 TaxID=1192854 RepID=A0A2Z2P2F0_9GAMM|nr:CBS domain-containing protein [Granulosicoccus antarcticus]ASJ73854.1 Hypoxic response protein 1 [Granulosicoccus antarcticus IMCC3135]